ncbi:MAG: PaaI family thioesterase [Clostridia bacterium]|nr:PaaI family thioesterase [Clostridia bacterium]
MSTFSTVEEAREYFRNDRFATVNGMELDELTEDGCVCSVTLGENHRNALGGVMGGVLFTLADFAFAIASNNRHRGTVAIDVSIHFLAAPKGGRLTARASCVKDGRTTAVYEVRIADDTGRDVALFVGTGYKL